MARNASTTLGNLTSVMYLSPSPFLFISLSLSLDMDLNIYVHLSLSLSLALFIIIALSPCLFLSAVIGVKADSAKFEALCQVTIEPTRPMSFESGPRLPSHLACNCWTPQQTAQPRQSAARVRQSDHGAAWSDLGQQWPVDVGNPKIEDRSSFCHWMGVAKRAVRRGVVKAAPLLTVYPWRWRPS